MEIDYPKIKKMVSQDLVDVFIRVGLIIFIVYLSVTTFAPFAGLILWALILAVALYPLQVRLAKKLKGRQGRAATVLVLVGILLIGVPTVMIGNSFANHMHRAYTAIENKTVTIEQPPEAVADWPLVGNKVHQVWSDAADNLPEFLRENEPKLKNLSKRALAAVANTAGSVLLFLASLIIAGIMMAYGEAGSQAMQKILMRLSGSAKGVQLQSLSTATIRSVATGVVGVAFIQALLLGVGFIFAGIPAAGLLALVVLLIGIVQLPATIISIPVIAYMWGAGDASTTSNIIFTVYLLVAGLADNVLKPLLLGRGVDAPMPVILLGALGGMVSAGIIGLFIGAVVLAVGYQVFMDWVDNTGEEASAGAKTTDTPDQSPPVSE